MHCQWARVSLVLVALAGAAFSAPLDPGGVSIDFEKVSARRFSAESADLGPELLRNGGFEVPLDSKVWWSNCWLQIPRNNRTPTIDANEARIVALGRKERVELAEGGSAFLLEIPAATDKLLPGLTQSIAATGSQFLRFTEPQGALRFSLRVRCDRLGKTTASPSLILNFKGEGRTFSAKGVKSYYSKVHRLPVTKDWTTFERIIPLHDDVRQVRVTLRLNGIARVWFDDVSVRRVTLEHPLETVLCAMAWMDNTFALSQKDPAFMWFVARKLRDVDLSESKLVLCVKLPAAVDVLEARESTRLMPPMPASDGFRTHRVDITRLRQHIRMDSFRSYTGYGLLVTTQAQPGVSLPDGEYWLERDGARATDVESFSLAVLPQLQPVSRPRKFHTGAILGPALRYGDRSAPMQARFLAATGMNWLHGITGSVLVKALREKGITLSAQPYYLCNGYRLGDKPKPEGARFVQTDGTAFPRAICPSEIYSDGPYYRDVVIPYLEKAIQDGMDHLMCNWEPYMFRGKGCFCPRCRREFASFTKQASEKVLAMKPEDILQGDRARWTAFRSSQHARQVTTLEKKIGEIGKACGRTESHLILEVPAVCMTNSERGRKHEAEVDPKDYGGQVKFIEPWGPYCWWQTENPYIHGTGRHLRTWETALRVRTFTDSTFADPPGILAFPHGIQCDTAVTEPEAITFETLCFFFAGYEGSFVYTFPRGYDNRYWQAIANANQFVATYEDIVLDRKEFTDFSVSCETPTPGEVAVKSAYFPNAAPLRIIQSVGFQRGDTRLLAVGNFWQRGECFFRLKVKLPEGAYVLRQPDRNLLFSNPSGASSWRASELASGALLHVGALRWACFTVEPADADTEAEALSQAEIRSCMSERMPAIQTALERVRGK